MSKQRIFFDDIGNQNQVQNAAKLDVVIKNDLNFNHTIRVKRVDNDGRATLPEVKRQSLFEACKKSGAKYVINDKKDDLVIGTLNTSNRDKIIKKIKLLCGERVHSWIFSKSTGYAKIIVERIAL